MKLICQNKIDSSVEYLECQKCSWPFASCSASSWRCSRSMALLERLSVTKSPGLVPEPPSQIELLQGS